MLSIVVRFHQGADIHLLRRALFSLLDTMMIDREVVVMVQYADRAIVVAVEAMCAEIFFDTAWRVFGIQVAEGDDRRGLLLAEGVRHARGAWLAFLDYDDIAFLSGFVRSVEIGDADGADLAIGQCLVAVVRGTFPNDYIVTKQNFVRHVPESPYFMLVHNFAPVCSFVVRRDFLERMGISFSPDLIRLEDYDFLLKVLAAGRISLEPLHRGVVNAQYNLNVDVGSTTLSWTHPASAEQQRLEQGIWEQARAQLRETSLAATVALSLQEVKQMVDAAAGGHLHEMILNLTSFVQQAHDLPQ